MPSPENTYLRIQKRDSLLIIAAEEERKEKEKEKDGRRHRVEDGDLKT
jgi:hypothetical protein